MFTVWLRCGKPDPGMSANGIPAGAVAMAAPCAVVSSVRAFVIGGWPASFGARDAVVGTRVSPEMELEGPDVPEMGGHGPPETGLTVGAARAGGRPEGAAPG